MLQYYMMTYYQGLKSGGKTQKTNKAIVEITKLGGKAVELKNMISLRREPSQLQHQMITLLSSYVIFSYFFSAQNVNFVFKIITQNGTSTVFL